MFFLNSHNFKKSIFCLFLSLISSNLFAGIADKEDVWGQKFHTIPQWKKTLNKNMSPKDYAVCNPLVLLLIESERAGEKFSKEVTESMGFLRGALVYYRMSQGEAGKSNEYFTKLQEPYFAEIKKDPPQAVSKYMKKCYALSGKIFDEVSK
jgi:hypothetical protein